MNVSMTEITEAKAWAIVPSYIGTMNVLKILSIGAQQTVLSANK